MHLVVAQMVELVGIDDFRAVGCEIVVRVFALTSTRRWPPAHLRVPASSIETAPLLVTLATNGGAYRAAERRIAGKALRNTSAISWPVRFPAINTNVATHAVSKAVRSGPR
jgi:hypothetical protein